MSDDLTEAGWPRPIVDGWPVPWVSPKHDLAEMHHGRATACASGAVCVVCGLGYQDGETAYALVCSPVAPGPDIQSARAMDNAIMHERCARLALGRCPRLKQLLREKNLRVLRTQGNCASLIREDDEDEFGCYIDMADAEDVGTSVPRAEREEP